MKNKFLFLFLLLTYFVNAQVGVGTLSPNVKSMLHIESVEKGVLIPRLTYDQITDINPSSGENGLFVYNTDENCINFWNGTSWQSLCGGGTVSNLATYSYTCSSAVISPEMTTGVNNSGTITVPVSVTGNGSIPAFSNTINGVTYTFDGISNATTSTTSIVIAYSGTPTAANSVLQLSGSSSNCNIQIPATVGTLYASSCTVNVNGTYFVETPLTNQNSISVVYSGITIPGYVNLVTEDKNGMKWATNGNILVSSTNNVVTLYPVVSNTKLFTITGDSVPNTSEESGMTDGQKSSNGANGSNDQTGTYAIFNTFNGTKQSLLCSATMDVKPAYTETNISRTAWYSTPDNTKLLGAQDSRVQLFMTKLPSTTFAFWKVMANNKSGSTIDFYSGVVSSSRDLGTYSFSGERWGNSDNRGSFDVYYQSDYSNGDIGSTPGDVGAHSSDHVTIGLEQSEAGIVIKIGDYWYKYRFTYNSTSSSATLDQSGNTMTILTLYGIYTSKPTPLTTYNTGATGNIKEDYKSYWP